MLWREPIEFASPADAVAALLLAFLWSSLLCFALTPLVRNVAARRGWLDRPDGRRKLHAAPVPRVGGLAVFAAFASGFALVLALPGVVRTDSTASESPFHLLLAAGGMCLVGLADDRCGLAPWVKLLAQVAAGLYIYGHGYSVVLVSNPFGPVFALGWISLPVTLLWVVGLTNAFNLIDGLDGLAAGVGLFATSVVLTFALFNDHPEIALLSVALGGSLLGFLRYNWSPASVFLGDCGSLTLGFVLAALSLRGSMKGPMVVAVATPLLALGFPILDTALALLRRLVGGRSILAGDADHIHHRIVRRGLTPRRAVILLYGVTAFFGVMALLAMTGRAGAVSVAVLAFSAVTWWLIRSLGEPTEHETAARLLAPVRARLRQSGDATEVWSALTDSAATLRVQGLVLRLANGNGGVAHEWQAPAADAPRWSWTLPLLSGEALLGELTVTQLPEDGRPQPPLPALFHGLADELAAAVARVR